MLRKTVQFSSQTQGKVSVHWWETGTDENKGRHTDNLAWVYVEGDTKGTIVPMDVYLELADNTDTGVWLDSHEEVHLPSSLHLDL